MIRCHDIMIAAASLPGVMAELNDKMDAEAISGSVIMTPCILRLIQSP